MNRTPAPWTVSSSGTCTTLSEFKSGSIRGAQADSTMVLEESDLDGRAAELDAEGLPYEGPQAVTASRIVRLDDPDGNRIVITGD
jgi:hypothetical protein